MRHAVVAEHMPVCDHTPYQLCFLLCVVAGEKKDRRHMLFGKHIQNIVRVAVLIPLIECQNDPAPVRRGRIGAIFPVLRIKVKRPERNAVCIRLRALSVSDRTRRGGERRTKQKRSEQQRREPACNFHNNPSFLRQIAARIVCAKRE